ncbi:MAG: DUF2079 domain-containing protein, partial [Anaerolineae bacterium]|nr:DUF2079 domain-containing protein [Anaerolineae bacterium]
MTGLTRQESQEKLVALPATETRKSDIRLWPSRLGLVGLAILLVAFNYYFIIYSLQRHAAFQTAGFDLGIFDQLLWNTTQGRPFAFSIQEEITSFWQVHFEPILFLLVPFYLLFGSARMLLIAQVVVVSLGAIPMYRLALWKLHSQPAALLYAAVYLLFPALQGALVFDFHGLTLASTFLSFALWYLFRQQYRWLLGTVILAMACKENVPLLVVMMGGYIFLIQRHVRWGLVIGGLGLVWFAAANFIIIPWASPVGENIHLERYSQWGGSMAEVVVN